MINGVEGRAKVQKNQESDFLFVHVHENIIVYSE